VGVRLGFGVVATVTSILCSFPFLRRLSYVFGPGRAGCARPPVLRPCSARPRWAAGRQAARGRDACHARACSAAQAAHSAHALRPLVVTGVVVVEVAAAVLVFVWQSGTGCCSGGSCQVHGACVRRCRVERVQDDEATIGLFSCFFHQPCTCAVYTSSRGCGLQFCFLWCPGGSSFVPCGFLSECGRHDEKQEGLKWCAHPVTVPSVCLGQGALVLSACMCYRCPLQQRARVRAKHRARCQGAPLGAECGRRFPYTASEGVWVWGRVCISQLHRGVVCAGCGQ